jgi:putative aldouronate transport system permease protein
MKIKSTLGEKAFDVLNVTLLLIISLIVLLPVLHVLAGSLSTTNALIHSKVSLWPVGFNLDNYLLVFHNRIFWRAFGVTAYVVCVGTLLNMVLTILTAYPLSKVYFKGRKFFMLIVIFTMIFQAPMIPSYLLIKYLGMLNSLWSLIIPGALSAFNMILCITFFRSLPEELFEAARVDGMSEYLVVWRIAIPISLPIIVTLFLFYAVGHWNNYSSALLYITDPHLRPLQLYLYMLLSQYNSNDSNSFMSNITQDISPQGLQMATIVVATIPILLIYPFVQKHFIKGSMLGSLKE